MKSKLLSIAILLLILAAGPLLADERSIWAPVKNVVLHIGSEESGDIFVFLEETGCSGTNDYFRITKSSTTTEERDTLVGLLLASKLSKVPLRLKFTRTNGTCLVNRIEF